MAETNTTEPAQVVQEAMEAWGGDLSKLELAAESVDVYHAALPDGEVHSRDEFEAFLREFSTAFPDFQVTIDDLLADDEVVMYEWTATGTHEAEYQGIPPTGRELDFTGMGKVLVSDGKIQEVRTYYNRQTVFEQLGLTED